MSPRGGPPSEPDRARRPRRAVEAGSPAARTRGSPGRWVQGYRPRAASRIAPHSSDARIRGGQKVSVWSGALPACRLRFGTSPSSGPVPRRGRISGSAIQTGRPSPERVDIRDRSPRTGVTSGNAAIVPRRAETSGSAIGVAPGRLPHKRARAGKAHQRRLEWPAGTSVPCRGGRPRRPSPTVRTSAFCRAPR